MQDLFDRVNFLTQEVERLRERDLMVLPSEAARRQNLVEGIINIPYRDAGGQDGSIRVSKDGVISSYVNPSEGLFPYMDLRVVGNVTTGLDSLHSYTLRAGTLAKDGDYIRGSYSGLLAGTANSKRIRILVDGQVLEDFGLFAFSTAATWKVLWEYARVSPTIIRASSIGMYGEPLVMDEGVVSGTPDIIFVARNTGLTSVSNLNTTDIVLLVQAEATATDDVQQTGTVIEYFRPRTVKLV
jgi:hypothetical protein